MANTLISKPVFVPKIGSDAHLGFQATITSVPINATDSLDEEISSGNTGTVGIENGSRSWLKSHGPSCSDYRFVPRHDTNSDDHAVRSIHHRRLDVNLQVGWDHLLRIYRSHNCDRQHGVGSDSPNESMNLDRQHSLSVSGTMASWSKYMLEEKPVTIRGSMDRHNPMAVLPWRSIPFVGSLTPTAGSPWASTVGTAPPLMAHVDISITFSMNRDGLGLPIRSLTASFRFHSDSWKHLLMRVLSLIIGEIKRAVECEQLAATDRYGYDLSTLLMKAGPGCGIDHRLGSRLGAFGAGPESQQATYCWDMESYKCSYPSASNSCCSCSAEINWTIKSDPGPGRYDPIDGDDVDSQHPALTQPSEFFEKLATQASSFDFVLCSAIQAHTMSIERIASSNIGTSTPTPKTEGEI